MDGLVPAVANVADPATYTLGTVFTSAVPGYVHGVRFMASTTLPDGPPIGLLYRVTGAESGTELARATVGAMTPGEWAVCLFPTPVPIAADVPHVAAYWVARGYAFTTGGLAAGISRGDLTAVPDGWAMPGVGPIPNGRYVDVPGPSLPFKAANGNNYFADVLFSRTP
ncbi:MAG TPA: DUF4082 domain-containing protein [Actinokineospora sp.]|jgi:hypothetical protein|nr:DUF4082 domain-containing protein [Actinokineospora sp.]